MGHRDLHRLAARRDRRADRVLRAHVLDRVDQEVRHRAAEQRRIDARACVARELGAQLRVVERHLEEREHARERGRERHVGEIGRALAAIAASKDSMSLTMMRRRSNASRFDSSVSRSRLAERSRASATCVWPIRMLTGSVCAAARCAGADGGGDSAGRAWPRPVGIMDGERDGGRGRQPGRQICSIPNAASFGRSSTSIWLYASRTAPSRSRC